MSFLQGVKTKLNHLPHLLGAVRLVGGLEISDSGLRYVWREGGEWKLLSQRLPVNVITNGIVKDEGLLLEALKILKKQVNKGHTAFHIVPVIVSLASSEVYMQSFRLPNVRPEELEKSIQLNLQMVSPSPLDEVYSGWQTIFRSEDQYNYEILGAFLKRPIADKLEEILKKARFRPVILESRALAIARALRELGSDNPSDEASLLLLIDDEGIDFLVLRQGQMYFEYLQLWKDLYGADHKLSVEEFSEALIRSMHQVMNFYDQRWKDPLKNIFILAHSLGDQVQSVISKNFNINTRLFVLKSGVTLGTEWYAGLGSALRGEKPRRYDGEISLLGRSAQEEYRWERLLEFFNFWGLLVPLSLILTMGAIFGARYIVQEEEVRSSEVLSRIGSPQQIEVLDKLETEARVFNEKADIIRSIVSNGNNRTVPFEKIMNIAIANDIKVARLASDRGDNIYTITGSSNSQDKIIDFKNVLSASKEFEGVNLPPSSIRRDPQTGTHSFSMIVSFISS